MRNNFYYKWEEARNGGRVCVCVCVCVCLCVCVTPLSCLTPSPFFKNFVHHPLAPLPHFLSPPTLTPTVLSVVLFLWLNGCSHHIWCVILLNDNMDLHMPSLGTLVPEGTWCLFYATRRQVYWGLSHNFVFYWYSDFVIAHTNPNTHSILIGDLDSLLI